MLCPSAIGDLIDADWEHNVHEDYMTYLFRDFEYLKNRIDYDAETQNLLAITIRPDSPPEQVSDFEFCGYDILDSYDSVSVLTNCGGFPEIFTAADINRLGLLDDLARANEIAERLRNSEPDDDHCVDCRVWSLSRYVGAP